MTLSSIDRITRPRGVSSPEDLVPWAEREARPAIEQLVRRVNELVTLLNAFESSGVQIPRFSTADRPDNDPDLVDAVFVRAIFNTTTSQLNIDDGEQWLLADGTPA